MQEGNRENVLSITSAFKGNNLDQVFWFVEKGLKKSKSKCVRQSK